MNNQHQDIGNSKTPYYYDARGKGRRGPGLAATTTSALLRVSICHTVGHGTKTHNAGTNPAGSTCRIIGWFRDGRVAVALPVGGYGTLGTADLAPGPGWTDDQYSQWDSLPKRSVALELEGDPR